MWTEQQLAYMKVLGLKLWQPNTVQNDVEKLLDSHVQAEAASSASVADVVSRVDSTDNSDSVDIAKAAESLEKLFDTQISSVDTTIAASKDIAQMPNVSDSKDVSVDVSNSQNPPSVSNKSKAELGEKTTVALYTFTINNVVLVSETDWDALSISDKEHKFVQAVLYSAVLLETQDEAVTEKVVQTLQMNHFRWPPSLHGLLAETPCSSAVMTYLNEIECECFIVFGQGLIEVLEQELTNQPTDTQEKFILSQESISNLINKAGKKKTLWDLLQSRLQGVF